MPKEQTWSEAIVKVLKYAKKPLHYTEITDLIIEKKYRTTIEAAPKDTVRKIIDGSIKAKGRKSPFVLTEDSIYKLADKPYKVSKEEQIIKAFGMFCRRDKVSWLLGAKLSELLGKQLKNAPPVDFYNQKGVYLLYDRREVIYVGRSEDKIGSRLKNHTTDRLSGRWDRFSWFGLLPISDNGELGDLPSEYNGDKLIPVLEAILIEAVEPHQNRRRGNGLIDGEFIQVIDP